MHYIVAVDAVFPSHRANEYDVWEIQTLVESAEPIAAFEQALAFADRAKNLEFLGYRDEPTLVGVRSIHEPLNPGEMTKIKCPHSWYVTKVATIDEGQLQMVKAFQKISIPFALLHID
jgi:hypothetical protein